ncbi:MAG: hypothetical protein KDK66_08000 [Deltaproteobacteria bacterium]|nr:hypothetical protein [Deltaproteobacteria bacterium]
MPSLYDREISAPKGLRLCLLKSGKGRKALYALAVLDYESTKPIQVQIQKARNLVKKAIRACWLIRELGLFLVFLAKEIPQQLTKQDLVVDRTGLHAVIVQGVHLIDSQNQHLYRHSQWASLTFGGAKEVSDQLLKLMA